MKTAISLPDQLFQRAESFANVQALSRSELYATALQEYLERYEGAAVTARLNALYAEEDSRLPAEVAELGFEVLRSEQLSRADSER